MNKEGNIFTGNTVFVLSSLFGLGILTLLVINPILQGYIAPALLATTSGATYTMLTTKFTFIISMVKFIPYILFAISIIYLLILIFRKERVDYYA